MIPRQTLHAMVAKIHSFNELKGCIVGLHGDNMCSVLHAGWPNSSNYGRVAVVIEEVVTFDGHVTANTQLWADTPGASPEGAPNPTVVTNRSVWGREAIGAGLSCGMTVVSAVGVFGGVAAEVPSGGTSTFLVIASWTGLVTGGIQCVNGVVRVAAIIANPDQNTLERWDANSIYSGSIFVVDALGVVSGLASLPSGMKNLIAILKRQKSLQGMTEGALRSMNRAERAAAIKKAMEEASRTVEGREAIMSAVREARFGAKTLTGVQLSVKNAMKARDLIGLETIRRLNSTLLGVISTPVGVAMSATPSEWIGSASGSVNTSANWLIHLVDAGK